jgi:hypothetical protein
LIDKELLDLSSIHSSSSLSAFFASSPVAFNPAFQLYHHGEKGRERKREREQREKSHSGACDWVTGRD